MAISNPSFGAVIAATEPVGSGEFTGIGSLNHSVSASYLVGNAAGQVDTIYTAARTVASSSSPDSVVLSSLTDPAGNAIAFVHVVDMILENTDSTNTLTVGGGTHPVAWLPTAGVPVAPGGALILHVPSGQPITAGSADRLQVVTSGGTAVAYNLTVIGRSA